MNSIAFYTFILRMIMLQSEAASGNLFQALTERDTLWKTLEIFITNCFTKYFGNFIMIGNWTTEESIILHDLFSNTIPVNLMAVSENNIFQKHQCFRGFFKINETVVSTKCELASNITILVSSNITLVNILENLRTSVWWNSKAYFLLVNTDLKNGCSSAREFLKLIWEYKILSALYFCKNINGHVIVYSFNPFAQIGTDIWKVVKDDGNESTRWTLLQFYEIYDIKCDNFDFDKTKNLDKYHIRMGSRKLLSTKQERLKRDEGYFKRDLKISRLILKRMNAVVTLKYYRTFGFVANNEPVGFLKDIKAGTLDFVGTQMFMRNYWKMMTYSIGSSGMCIVARMYPVPFAERFMSILTLQVWLCLIVTSFLSVITFKCILNESLADSSMEFLRIFFATPSLRSPTSSRSRFFLVNILYLIFLINLYIQSRLNAIQTAPDYTPAIDSPDDLIQSNLQIYGEAHHREFVYHTELRERFQEIRDIHTCLKGLVDEEKLACLAHTDELRTTDYVKDEIYKARNNLFDGPTAFTFVEDWPLAARVNMFLLYTNEMGIYRLYSEKQVWNNDKVVEQKIDMKQMTFCFLIFFCGCVLSVCTLFVELIIHKIRAI